MTSDERLFALLQRAAVTDDGRVLVLLGSVRGWIAGMGFGWGSFRPAFQFPGVGSSTASGG